VREGTGSRHDGGRRNDEKEGEEEKGRSEEERTPPQPFPPLFHRCSSGDAEPEGLGSDAAMAPRAAPLPPSSRMERLGGVERRVLGTTLGRACSRGCRERKVRSKIGWLAGSRDSHHVSRFAAFFILARAEISATK